MVSLPRSAALQFPLESEQARGYSQRCLHPSRSPTFEDSHAMPVDPQIQRLLEARAKLPAIDTLSIALSHCARSPSGS